MAEKHDTSHNIWASSGGSHNRTGMAKKVALFVGKLLVSAAMLWFVFSRIGLDQVITLMSSAVWYWLLAATALFALSKWVSAIRLNHFFRAAGLHLPERINLQLYLLGMFYNLFLPGGISGDAYKVILLRQRKGATLKNLITATLLDRVTGLVALVMITLLLLVLLPIPIHLRVMAALCIPLIPTIARWALNRYFKVFTSLFLRTNLQSAAVQILQLLAAVCILKALHFDGDYTILLALFLVSSVMAVIPVSFGGAGAREFTFAVAATWLTLPDAAKETAITLGLLFYLITAAVSLTGVVFLFRPIKIPENQPISS